jgi:hypothetical protein
MLFGETAAVYCENHTEHTDIVRTSQETHYVSATETNRLMLFGVVHLAASYYTDCATAPPITLLGLYVLQAQ